VLPAIAAEWDRTEVKAVGNAKASAGLTRRHLAVHHPQPKVRAEPPKAGWAYIKVPGDWRSARGRLHPSWAPAPAAAFSFFLQWDLLRWGESCHGAWFRREVPTRANLGRAGRGQAGVRSRCARECHCRRKRGKAGVGESRGLGHGGTINKRGFCFSPDRRRTSGCWWRPSPTRRGKVGFFWQEPRRGSGSRSRSDGDQDAGPDGRRFGRAVSPSEGERHFVRKPLDPDEKRLPRRGRSAGVQGGGVPVRIRVGRHGRWTKGPSGK